MIARIEEVAGILHLEIEHKKCSMPYKPLIILVDNEASDTAADLAKRFPVTLRRDGVTLLADFVRSRKPVRWLSLTNPNGFNGARTGTLDVQEGRASYAPRSSGVPTRLKGNQRPEVAGMIVIVDGKQMADVSLEALSDYISFVAFANPRQGGETPATSVMSLFDNGKDASVTEALTSDDLSYLQALYATAVDSLGQTQRNSIVSSMVRTDRKSRQP